MYVWRVRDCGVFTRSKWDIYIPLPLPKAQGSSRIGNGKSVRARGNGWLQGNMCYPDTAQQHSCSYELIADGTAQRPV